MTWAKLDDAFPEHQRIIGLTDRAFRLHVASICMSARKLTDGHIGVHDQRVLLALTKANTKHISELQDAGVWEANGNEGYVIRDYLDYNPPADTVKERRKADAERLRNYRSTKGRT